MADLNANDLLQLLRRRYSAPLWWSFDELRVSAGYSHGEQRLDFWAMHSYPSKSFQRLGFEIKVHRSDFTRELQKPEKRRPALLLCNRFYFVAPVGVVPIEKLPIDAGLIEPYRNGRSLTVVHEAPWIDTSPPPWGFVVALLRRHDGQSEPVTDREGGDS